MSGATTKPNLVSEHRDTHTHSDLAYDELKLGWKREDGPYVLDSEHERMTGAGREAEEPKGRLHQELISIHRRALAMDYTHLGDQRTRQEIFEYRL